MCRTSAWPRLNRYWVFGSYEELLGVTWDEVRIPRTSEAQLMG